MKIMINFIVESCINASEPIYILLAFPASLKNKDVENRHISC